MMNNDSDIREMLVALLFKLDNSTLKHEENMALVNLYIDLNCPVNEEEMLEVQMRNYLTLGWYVSNALSGDNK